MNPTIGRIVLVALANSQGAKFTRPGIITNVITHTRIQATVFKSDGDGEPLIYPTQSIQLDESQDTTPSWSWPPRS